MVLGLALRKRLPSPDRIRFEESAPDFGGAAIYRSKLRLYLIETARTAILEFRVV